MPIYEYRCPECGHEQEQLVRDLDAVPVCGECGGRGLQRKLSAFAVASSRAARPEAHGCACAADGEGCPGSSAGYTGHGSSGGCGHSGSCGCG